jgi:hypothetical protein
MRTLICVPIIHTSADLGSLSKEVTERGIAGLGEEIWEQHRQTVAGLWCSIRNWFDGIDVTGMKIYQDGMVADGDVGRKIVEDTAGAGSPNYQLVLELLQRGAALVKTEDFGLVKREYDRLIAMTRAKSMGPTLLAAIRYKITKSILLRRRDAFIARRIDKTLELGATGILFIGAVHNVARWLVSDITIKEVKDQRKVRDYQRLLPFHSKHPQQFEELGRYLVT